jgi:hypothetical protein
LVNVRKGLERGDGGHNLISDLLVELFETSFGASSRLGANGFEVERTSIFDGDRSRPGESAMAAVSLVGAKNTNRDDGSPGLKDNQTHTGTGTLELAIPGAGAFRKNDDSLAGLEHFENATETGSATAVAVHRDGVPGSEEGSDPRKAKQSIAGQKAEGTRQWRSDQRRIQIAGVIGS